MKIKYLSALPMIAVLVLSGFSLTHAQSDVFNQNLYYGLQNNPQVTQLQEFLTSQGLYSGPITGNYYFLTLGAVKAFQAQRGITPAAGYFGPMTMAAANKIADAEIGASNTEAITETGTSTPSVAPASSTVQLQLQALLQEVALLQQQLQAQQSSTQQQSQTLQQIAQNTTPPVVTVPAPTPTQPQASTPAPTASITVNGSANSINIPYGTATTISWHSTNANACSVSPMGWSGISSNQSTGNLTASQTYTLSCSGAGGSTSASLTVNVSAPPIEETSTPSAVSGTCQLSVQNVIENNSNLQGSLAVSKAGGTEDGVSLYASIPNSAGYLSTSTQWTQVMNPVDDIPLSEPFSYQGFSSYLSNFSYATTTKTLWFKASYPDGTACYDVEQVTVPPPTPLLTVSQNSLLATPVSAAASSSHVEIGSYNFQASSASGAQVNTLTFQMGSSSSPTFQNVGVWVNGTQFGTTQNNVTSNQTISFSGSPFTVPANQMVSVNVYADILSSATSTSMATTLSGLSATGLTSYNAINLQSPVSGQDVMVVSQ